MNEIELVCTTSELKEKVVINICDGKKLGYICDFGIDVCKACFTAIVVGADSGLFGMRHGDEIVIKWEKIIKIGEDAILVDIGDTTENLSGCNSDNCGNFDCDCGYKKKKKKRLFF